jgi:hypothetical protein
MTMPQSGATPAGGHHVVQEHRVETVTRVEYVLPGEPDARALTYATVFHMNRANEAWSINE